MKKFHYTDGKNSFGPFTLEELKSQHISPDTYIWESELTTWTKAKDVAEVASMFQGTTSTISTPPPVMSNTDEAKSQTYQPYSASAQQQTRNYERPPKTYLIEAILSTIFCCWVLGIPSIVYAASVERKFYSGDREGAEEASKKAKKWMIINIVSSILMWLLYLGFYGTAVIWGFFNAV